LKLFSATYNLCIEKMSNKKVEGSPLSYCRCLLRREDKSNDKGRSVAGILFVVVLCSIIMLTEKQIRLVFFIFVKGGNFKSILS